MPPKKRKAVASIEDSGSAGDEGDGNGDAPILKPAKKARREDLRAQKERARQWALARKQGQKGGEGGGGPSSLATTSKSTDVTIAASSKTTKTPSKTTKTPSKTTKTPSKTKPTTERTRRSTGTGRSVAVTTTVEITGPSGTPIRSPQYAARIEAMAATDDAGERNAPEKAVKVEKKVEETGKKYSAKKQKIEALERARAWNLKKQQEKKNEAADESEEEDATVAIDENPSPDDPVIPPAAAETKSSEPAPDSVATVTIDTKQFTGLPSPDPPSSTTVFAAASTNQNRSALDPPPSLAAASASTSRASPFSSDGNTNGRVATPKVPPAVVSSLFAQPKSSSSVHCAAVHSFGVATAVEREKCDPDQPWPSKAYKLRTAANSGYDPMPFSSQGSSEAAVSHLAAAVVGGAPSRILSDLCTANDQHPSGKCEGMGESNNGIMRKSRNFEGITLASAPSYGRCAPPGSSPASGQSNQETSRYGMPMAWNPTNRRHSQADDHIFEEKKKPARPSPAVSTDASGYPDDEKVAGAVSSKMEPAGVEGVVREAIQPPKATALLERGSRTVSSEYIARTAAMVEVHSHRRSTASDPPVTSDFVSTIETQTDTPAKPTSHGNNASVSIRKPSVSVASVGRSNLEAKDISDDGQTAEEGDSTTNKIAGAELDQRRSEDASSLFFASGVASDTADDNTNVNGKDGEASNREMPLENQLDDQHSVDECSEEEQNKEPSKFKKILRGFFTIVSCVLLFPIMHFLYLVMHKMNVEPHAVSWGEIQDLRFLPSFLRPDYETPQLIKTADGETRAAGGGGEEETCFMDHPRDFYFVDEGLTQDQTQCVGNIPCPQWGRCHGGRLRDCLYVGDNGGEVFSRFVPNDAEVACVPGTDAMELVNCVSKSLTNMTLDQMCDNQLTSARNESLVWLDEDDVPLFTLSTVATKVNEDFDVVVGGTKKILMSAQLLLWLYPVFDDEMVRFGTSTLSGNEGGTLDAIGLMPGYVDDALPLPWSCSLQIMAWEVMKFLGEMAVFLMVTLAKYVAFISWRFGKKYPIFSFCAVIVLCTIERLRRLRSHRKRVREIADLIHEAVLDRLAECEDGEGYAALMLRDDIGHDKYHNDLRARLFMYGEVWARVQIDIRSDNRIRKFRKVVSGGKELEHWEMIATPAKRGRRLRKSMNVDNTQESAGSNCNDMAESGGARKDPPPSH